VTNFLPAAFIKDNMEELREGLQFLQRLLDSSAKERELILEEQARQGCYTTYDQLLWQTVGELLHVSQRTCDVLDDLPSDPVIYTGPGSTSEVIRMLERLMYEHRKKKQPADIREVGND